MRIIYDFDIFFLQKFGGISRYFINISNLLTHKKIYAKIVSPLHTNEYLKINNSNNGFYIDKYPRYTRKIIYNLNKRIFNFSAKLIKPDIVHKTYYHHHQKIKKTKTVLTIYDLTHELMSTEYNYKGEFYDKKKAIDNSDKIICISENTKKDLINHYQIQEDKVKVIYLGGNHLGQVPDIPDKENNILYVGSREKYKNFKCLINAYSNSTFLKKNFKIICFGGGSFTKKELDFFYSKKINIKNITAISGNDMLLKSFYLKSKVHVITSYNEGFGITAVEAMNLNCPVISSNKGSMPEIITDDNDLFDPDRFEDLKNKLEKLLISDELITQKIKNGKIHSKKFTWEKCAEKTLDLYNSLT